jgi:predicted acetyltransferase
VYPTHRRRGVLRAMMRAQLDAAHDRGDPIAALWASEETIYGRFGYGIASWDGELAIKKEWSAFARPLERRGRVRIVTAEEAASLFPPVWDAFRRARTGAFARTAAWWTGRVLRTPDEQKATPKRFAVLELDGETQAYAIYRTTANFEEFVSNAKLEVLEAIGATPQATAEIWRYLLDIDWMATVHVYLAPPDHPLFLLLANPRRARYRMAEGLWVRLVDVGTALSGRTYAGDGSVVFDVRDAFCPWNEGRWRVAGGTAERTDAEADLALDVAAMGSAFFGGIHFEQLAQGGRVEELRAGAVERADGLFRHGLHPWCPEIF